MSESERLVLCIINTHSDDEIFFCVFWEISYARFSLSFSFLPHKHFYIILTRCWVIASVRMDNPLGGGGGMRGRHCFKTHICMYLFIFLYKHFTFSLSRSLCVHSYDHDNVDNECGIRETTTTMMMMEKSEWGRQIYYLKRPRFCIVLISWARVMLMIFFLSLSVERLPYSLEYKVCTNTLSVWLGRQKKLFISEEGCKNHIRVTTLEPFSLIDGMDISNNDNNNSTIFTEWVTTISRTKWSS